MNLKEIFNQKTTEKGDIAFSSTWNTYIDILFMSEYYGNIFMSGYSPMLLKYLSAGFNSKDFLDNMLKEYAKKLIENKDKLV